MTQPLKQDIGWRPILRINGLFVSATIALFYGWLCWQMASPEWWAFWLVAMLSALGGALQLLRALFELIGLLLRLRRWRRFEASGVTPRADPMVTDADFERRDRR